MTGLIIHTIAKETVNKNETTKKRSFEKYIDEIVAKLYSHTMYTHISETNIVYGLMFVASINWPTPSEKKTKSHGTSLIHIANNVSIFFPIDTFFPLFICLCEPLID